MKPFQRPKLANTLTTLHHRPVRGKLPLLFTLASWLIATGSHWDLVQIGAWGRMFAQNVQVLPLSAALKLTFSEEGRCNVCSAVSSAKESGPETEASAAGKLSSKMLVFFTQPALFWEAPAKPGFQVVAYLVESRDRSAPAVPPPRG